MNKTSTEKKLSFKNWKSSRDKWTLVLKKTKNHEPFTKFGWGFKDLPVIEPCGYCKDLRLGDVFNTCAECTLFAKNICVYDGENNDHIIFWQYVGEMRKCLAANWEKAITLATTILNAIKEDDPRKNRKHLKKEE